jgi:hypothetical protein
LILHGLLHFLNYPAPHLHIITHLSLKITTCCIAAEIFLVHLYHSRRANKATNNSPHQTKVQKWNIFLSRAIWKRQMQQSLGFEVLGHLTSDKFSMMQIFLLKIITHLLTLQGYCIFN